MGSWRDNWAGNVRIGAAEAVRPGSVGELARAVADAADRGLPLKALGRGHSFNDAMDTPGLAVRTDRLPRSVAARGADPDLPGRTRVRITGQPALVDTFEAMHALGLALDDSGSNARPSLIGSLATASHGSSVHHGGLSHPDVVRRVELIGADGTLRAFDASEPADRPTLRALRAHLGALGLVTAVEVAARPAYHLRLDTRRGPLDEALDPAVRDVPGRRYEFFFYPGHEDRVVRITRDETDAPVSRGAELRAFWNEVVTGNVLLGGLLHAATLDPSVGVPLLREAVLASTPEDARDYVDTWVGGLTGERLFRALSSEHAVPVDRLSDALAAVGEVVARFQAEDRYWLDLPVNVRFTRGDGDTCLSPASGEGLWAWVDVSVFAGGQGHGPFLDAVEDALRPLGARPHLAKVFRHPPGPVWDPDGWDHFRAVRDRLDPDRRFDNAFLRRLWGEEPPESPVGQVGG